MSVSNTTKFFVTGGAGFIGSHLVDRLVGEGNIVTVYDNLVSGRVDDIKQHFGKDNFTFIQADLLDYDTLKEAMKGHEIIWHLGANTDIPTGNKVTDLDLKNCTIATRNVLEAMVQHGINRMLFSSTAAAYGDKPGVVYSETFGPLLPISLYGAGKLACEGLVSAYCHLFGIKAWMFRFANVIGGRMGHGVIYDFIQKLKKNPGELEIYGGGKQERPYFLVEDCIDGMFCALNNSDSQCDIFNLGCDFHITVDEVAQIVTEEMGLKNVKFKHSSAGRGWPGDVMAVHFDISKIKKLGWSPTHTPAEAVRLAARRLLGEKG